MASENQYSVEFSWRVAAGGHRWVASRPMGGDKEARQYLTDGIAPGVPYRYTRFFPLKGETGLFKIFAETQTTPEAVLKFANEYGMLGGDKGCVIELGKAQGNAAETLGNGEPQSVWFKEILDMRRAIHLWDLIQNRDTQTLGRHFTWREDDILYQSMPDFKARGMPKEPFSVVTRSIVRDQTTPDGQLRFQEGDLIQPALQELQRVINERLTAETAVRLLWDPDTGGLILRLAPKSLLGAMWFQFAELVEKGQSLRQCEVCGKWFKVAAGLGRIDKKYCSQRCRTQWYRNRTAEAARLAAKGMTPREIAKKLNTDVLTAEAWIASGNTPVQRRRSKK